ncbi:acyl-CoA synthetase FdrA [Acetobacter sp. DsW_059]|uniref:acyl-CoA synthetase FdrA n=1 Tax=Acetobacter sp. DsW_059 TaxID=1670661 RepID=UPI000A3D5D61|nr:acyl-CoA synthetase FdrA [Acetobacter sp. DsW_059]OUJ12088.1 transcriptional regulator [Acetobacter sp. DsW_059]
MTSRILIRPREYHDSVRLMRASEAIRQENGVTEAMTMMATVNNKKILDTSGLLTDAVKAANPDDLIIAVVADTEEAAERAVAAAQSFLSQKVQSGQQTLQPRSVDAACALNPAINMACISLPGVYAYREAKRALELGLNVFLFSDNVSREDERKLKELAQEKNRLLMGPDCGTALINGVGLGFANAVRKGKVGLVAASGTGTQEISSLLDWLHCGVSQAIGTGGRDLQHDIGGLTMLQGLAMLAADHGTDVIVVTSKPPSPEIAEKIIAFCSRQTKPVVINFIGQSITGQKGNITFTSTLAETALTAARLLNPSCELPHLSSADTNKFMQTARAARKPSQRYLRGLYAGGTLCYEALFLLREQLGGIYSNLEHGAYELKDLFNSKEHTIIDMGEDAYTEGRAHPMIDPSLRNQRILREAQDPDVALLLLDLVIGYGAHENPAAQLAETITQARAITQADGRDLPVIVTICGTENDIQNYEKQAEQLWAAGILVAGNNAEAVTLAGHYLETLND